jgi:sialidase-1
MRQKELGVWMIRSTDGGLTWSPKYDSLVNSPHGPIQLADGRLLYAGKDLWRAGARVGVCESTDDGQTWRWLAEIPPRDGDKPDEYHELHAVDCGGGRILMQIRNHNPANKGETLQCESADGGKRSCFTTCGPAAKLNWRRVSPNTSFVSGSETTPRLPASTTCE